ncbi:MAG: putative lipopolysaccharide heptosyltransferase III [Gammaproteobacteria bacterium]
MADPIFFKRPPSRILLIALRYLGDALLTTPLLRSLKQAYPEAKIDLLVYRNTAGMFEGNRDIDQVITTPNRPSFAENRKLASRIFRHYDLAITVQAGDRPFLYSLLAAPNRIGIVPHKGATGWWKRYFMQGYVEHDNENTHTVLQNLKLAGLLAIPRCHELVPPRNVSTIRWPLSSKDPGYAVLHPYPQWAYKQWPMDNWVGVGRYLAESGVQVVLSGGPAEHEIRFVAELEQRLPGNTVNLAGQATLAELAEIIGGARCFIGPDTGITHLAAAMQVPVIALYGPTNPIKWAPWPSEYRQDQNPFDKVGDQQVKNVHLIQGAGECVPCDLEGCERHRQSRSKCLDGLPLERVIEALDRILSA